MTTARLTPYFPRSYEEARAKLLAAAARPGALAESHLLPNTRGAAGETLTMDAAAIGEARDRPLLIVSCGTHGVGGLVGSGCQIALLHDGEFLDRLATARVALLLIHAINPYGFSHLRRGNEHNIDLDRNFLRFEEPLPACDDYLEIHELLVPTRWPVPVENETQLKAWIASHGERAFRDAVTRGQSERADGLFYCGTAPAWSNTTLRALLRKHGAQRRHIAWIDLHSGPGPYGHGEKIFAGTGRPGELERARCCWGADVFSPAAGESASQDVQGGALPSLYDECPQAQVDLMALEFGTVAYRRFLDALRADQWLHNHPETGLAQRHRIKQELVDVFYVDSDEWRGMVAAQARAAVLQAAMALGRYEESTQPSRSLP